MDNRTTQQKPVDRGACALSNRIPLISPVMWIHCHVKSEPDVSSVAPHDLYSPRVYISYKDHATNEEVRAKIQQAIGPHEDLLTIVKRRKLLWYGHVSRSSSLAKTILQCTVKRGRRQGGQRKRWEDNIREWAGLEFGKSQRAVENREKWRKLVAKSSVVSQRPSRLRD